ncbi:MAG: ABC transporter ATP-binding protein [Fidelibacterota bacterium]
MQLRLHNVRKEFNSTVAVDDLSINVPKGSVFGLVGPNGAGKTTTLRMIMNIVQPDRGEIYYDGNPIGSDTLLRVGYLPEERGLYLKANLLETVIYLGMLKGLSQNRAKDQAYTYLERFGLKEYATRKIEELSKGNQQKVQFIIAILHDPDLLILDEPFSGLDPVNQLELKQIISDFHKQGKTIVFSAHQMEQVERLCQDICMIHRGRQVLYGNLAQIKQNYGVRRFRIHYSGSQNFIKRIAAPEWTVAEDQLSGELNPAMTINDILMKIISRVTITNVQVSEASLEQIFIDRVKESTNA